MRLFVAIDLPEVVLGELETTLQPARETGAHVSWTRAYQRHLTVQFLGDQTDQQLQRLTHELDAACERHRAFGIALGGFGAFPNFRRARVVWLGVEQEARLELLHHDVACACMNAGFQLEARAFRPHITLARVRTNAETDGVKDVVRMLRRQQFGASVVVNEIVLYESVIGDSGSVYQKLHTSALRGR